VLDLWPHQTKILVIPQHTEHEQYADCLYAALSKCVTGTVPVAAAAAIFPVSHGG